MARHRGFTPLQPGVPGLPITKGSHISTFGKTFRPSRRVVTGFTLIEIVIYTALLAAVSVIVVNLIINTGNAFTKARVSRTVHEEGNAALERMVREIRLADTVNGAASVMDAHPGTLVLNTVVSPTDATPITRRFYLAGATLMMQEGSAAAVPLSAGVRMTNLVFRDAGKMMQSNALYYVRGSYAGCSNANDGLTPATAFCTISKAATLATAGSTVAVGAGTYNETVVLTSSGTVNEPISYLADVGGGLTGDAGAVIVRGGTYGFRFMSTGSSTGIDYTTIEGFSVTATTYGIWGAQGSDYDTIRNNTIYANGDGIFLTTTAGNGSFAPGTGWLIEFNDIYSNTTNGVNFNDGEYTNVVLQYNSIRNNGTGILATDRGNGGFEPANAVTLRHNDIYGNTGRGVSGHAWFDGTFFDNHIYANGSDGFATPHRSNTSAEVVTFRNNTINGNGGDGLLFGNESNRSALDATSVIENNIITQNGESGIDTTLNQCAVIRNNIVWGNTAANYNGCTSVASGFGNLSSDPLYVAPASDVHLQAVATGHTADSPAIDSGYQTAADAGLDARFTRTDGVPDAGVVDRGYHYGTETPGVQQYFAGDPVSQAIRIELTVEGGAARSETVESLTASAVLRGSYR